MRRRGMKIAYSLASTFMLAALCVSGLARYVPGFARRFADGPRATWYRGVDALLAVIGAFLGQYTLFESALLALVGVLAVWGVCAVIRAFRTRTLLPVSRWICSVLCGVIMLLALLIGLWLPMYSVPPMDGGATIQTTSSQLEQLISQLDQAALADSPSLLAFPDGSTQTAYTRPELYALSHDAYSRLGLGNAVTPPKQTRANSLLRALGIAGMYIPFTGETVVVPDETDSALPFTLAHELAHQLGYAREDEANLVAYAVCVRSDVPEFRYSANLTAIRYALLSLRATDEAAFEAALDRLSPRVQSDLDAQHAFYTPARRSYGSAISAFNTTAFNTGEYIGLTRLMLQFWNEVKPLY